MIFPRPHHHRSYGMRMAARSAEVGVNGTTVTRASMLFVARTAIGEPGFLLDQAAFRQGLLSPVRRRELR